MKYTLEAACACSVGKVRKNNEDNFFFDGKSLEAENSGLKHPVSVDTPAKNGQIFAVFDGMGGENFGELASFAAARELQKIERGRADFFVPERTYLSRLTEQLNLKVVEAAKEQHTNRMGTTMTALYFTSRYVYVCNLGDSRAYRLRDGEFMQVSVDHVDSFHRENKRKAALTQFLGIDPDEILLEPHIAKGELKRGDQYLICSDGLSDMLTNFEISDIMLRSSDVESCTEALIDAALAHGGIDNTTVIVCKIV